MADVNTSLPAATSDLTRDPPARKSRKGKKVVYETSSRKRNRINRDYGKSMSKKIKEWHTKTKIPVILLTYRNNAVRFECSEGLESFAQDPVVHQAFVSNVIKCGTSNISKDKPLQTQLEVSFPTGPDIKYDDYTVGMLRKMVTQAVMLDGRKLPYWTKMEKKPNWWPRDIDYRNVNWGQNKPRLDELVKVMEAFRDHFEENSSRSSDGDSMDGNGDNVIDGMPAEEDNHDDEIEGEMNLEQPASMEEVETENFERQVMAAVETFETASVRVVLETLKRQNNWAKFLGLCQLVEPLLKTIEVDTTGFITKAMVHKSMRCQIPPNLQRNTKEPAKVKADGNCLFHAVALAIDMNGKYVSEDLASMLRLYTVVQGATKMEYFVQKLSENFSDEGQLRNLMHTATTENVLSKQSVQSAPTDLEAFQIVYMEEAMSTAYDGKYSGIFQVMWLAYSIPVTINMHCCRPGFDLFNNPVTVRSQHTIDILWVDLKNEDCTTPNHIVPLLPTSVNELMNRTNTCAADEYCQLQNGSIQSGMITCNHCLQLFHVECVFFVEPTIKPGNWTCGCSTMFSEINYVIFEEESLDRWIQMTSKPTIKELIKNLVHQSCVSRRFSLLKNMNSIGAASTLKTLTRCYSKFDVDAVGSLMNKIIKNQDIVKDAGYADDDRAFVQLVQDVLTPEVLIFLLHKNLEISRWVSEWFYEKATCLSDLPYV